jgi:hypothetical protein
VKEAKDSYRGFLDTVINDVQFHDEETDIGFKMLGYAANAWVCGNQFYDRINS